MCEVCERNKINDCFVLELQNVSFSTLKCLRVLIGLHVLLLEASISLVGFNPKEGLRLFFGCFVFDKIR